jgi:hypothetical protein
MARCCQPSPFDYSTIGLERQSDGTVIDIRAAWGYTGDTEEGGMSTVSAELRSASLYTRIISRGHSPWTLLGIGLLLVAAPLLMARLDGVLVDFLRQDTWRLLMLPPVIILYILIIAPIMFRAEEGVLNAFRPVVEISDDEFALVVAEASQLNPIIEAVSFGLGMALGLWSGGVWVVDHGVIWLGVYLPLSIGLMYGLLAWTIYAVVASTRLNTTLHRQPLNVDIFDLTPFKPIGRQSLVSALAFIGGIVLSMIFGFRWSSIYSWEFWLILVVMAIVPALIFFLSMRDTHRVLAEEKGRELTLVQARVVKSSRFLLETPETSQDAGMLGAEISALVAYEQRLQAASTWPYDTAMLRTLVFSVIIPGGAALARAASEFIFD